MIDMYSEVYKRTRTHVHTIAGSGIHPDTSKSHFSRRHTHDTHAGNVHAQQARERGVALDWWYIDLSAEDDAPRRKVSVR